MSKHETPLTRAYWETVGGTLIEEFVVVPKGPESARRAIDGLIALGGDKRMASWRERIPLDARDLIAVQTKAGRIDAGVVGQAILTPRLIRRMCSPGSLRSVLVCTTDDEALHDVLRAHPDVSVHLIDGKGYSKPTRGPSYPRDRALIQRFAQAVGGTLILDYPLSGPSRKSRRFVADGIFVPDGPNEMLRANEAPSLRGRDVVGLVATKDRPGMFASGKAIATLHLARKVGLAMRECLILCRQADAAVAAVLKPFENVRVVPVSAP